MQGIFWMVQVPSQNSHIPFCECTEEVGISTLLLSDNLEASRRTPLETEMPPGLIFNFQVPRMPPPQFSRLSHRVCNILL